MREFLRSVWSNLFPILTVLLLWELVVRLGWVNAFFLPPASVVLAKFAAMVASGELFESFRITAWRMTFGFAIGASAALVLGLAIGLSRPLLAFFSPLVAATYPLPKIALISIFLVIFGIGDPPIIASVAISTFYPILISTLTGLRSVDPILLKAAEDLGANRYQITVKVVLPGALPVIMSGMKMGTAVALIVVVAVEMYIGQTGAGHVLAWATEFFKIDLLYANVIAIGLFGIVLFKLVDIIERLLVPWANRY